MIYAAVQPGDTLLSITEVTNIYQLSRNHVMKVAQKLGQLGYLNTLRGKGGGGFHIDKNPRDINTGQLIRELENSLSLINCKEPACRISPVCQLKGVLGEALEAFLKVLDQYTLKDLVGNRQELIQVLRLYACMLIEVDARA